MKLINIQLSFTATQAARKRPANFDQLKTGYLQGIAKLIKDNNIPDELVLNLDQTGLKMVPTSTWTMEESGVSQVSIYMV